MRMLAAVLAAVSAPAFHVSIRPLSGAVLTEVGHSWHSTCPVPLSNLRLLDVSAWGFDGHVHQGQLIVNADAAAGLGSVFRQLFDLRFPIRHLTLKDEYGPAAERAPDGDISGSFECRQAVPSPCVGGTGTGTWSEHAYGEAVDLNPHENPYVGCGMAENDKSSGYLDRSRIRPGMVTPAVIQAFARIGWGWGGSWYGSTKDYMHFSANGH